MALLGESCRVLLQCLTVPSWTETTDEEASISITGKAAQCGSWLCRIYEEVCILNCRFYVMQNYSNAHPGISHLDICVVPSLSCLLGCLLTRFSICFTSHGYIGR